MKFILPDGEILDVDGLDALYDTLKARGFLNAVVVRPGKVVEHPVVKAEVIIELES